MGWRGEMCGIGIGKVGDIVRVDKHLVWTNA